ncbi:hypothetical protein CB1_001108050 [Camelus ferus]|nr:hypothetical protein CB1_001108050 [Camelus ferus]
MGSKGRLGGNRAVFCPAARRDKLWRIGRRSCLTNLRFRLRHRLSVSTAPPRACVAVPTKIVPSFSPYRAAGGSLPSLPPLVERLRRSDGCEAADWLREYVVRRCIAPPSELPVSAERAELGGLAKFCLINAGVLYLYFSNYLQIDEEEYGGTWELTKEGFMTSFALFMVIWIIFYTAIHYD